HPTGGPDRGARRRAGGRTGHAPRTVAQGGNLPAPVRDSIQRSPGESGMTRKRYVAAWALALLAAGLMGCGNPGDVSPDEPGQASAPPAVTSEADAEAGAPAPAP